MNHILHACMFTSSIRMLSSAALLAVLAISIEPPATVHAATLTVTTVEDTSDGRCGPPDCSLREAIAAAAPGDTIEFDRDLRGQAILLESELMIDKDLTIMGPDDPFIFGGEPIAISGQRQVRVFNIATGNVTLSRLIVLDGQADVGGGILVAPVASLILQTILLWNNSASVQGGGIFNSGEVRIQDSDLLDNAVCRAPVCPGADEQTDNPAGGGIFNDQSGFLRIADSLINQNHVYAGDTEVGKGGGIYNEGTLKVITSYFYENIVTGSEGQGGGLFNSGTARLKDDALSYNLAIGGGGGGIQNTGILTVLNSTINNNWAGFLHGGGILNEGLLFLNNDTITQNRSLGPLDVFGAGGGIANDRRVLIWNTILANNYSRNDYRRLERIDNCHGTALDSRGHNLLGIGCSDSQTTDLTVDDSNPDNVGLAGLSFHYSWGLPTFVLSPNSPAVDHGSPIIAPYSSELYGCESTDQRGVQRPEDGNEPPDGQAVCDIGAYERQP